ncbi:unnamed protein product [Rhizopus microsporus]
MLLPLARTTLKNKLNEKLQKQTTKTCTDCHQPGHLNKHSPLCPQYIKIKKRKFSGKDDFATKQAKKKGRLNTGASSSSSSSVICSSCGTSGHKSSRSMQCPNSKPTKDAIIKAAYGGEYEVYARKVYLKSILREEHAPLIQRIATLPDFIRNVTFRAQLFVNYLSVENKEKLNHNHLKSQNFWYAVCQLVMGEKVTNKDYVDNFVVLAFDDFKTAFGSIIYDRKRNCITGHSDSLSAACVTLATTYLNHIVENFKKRFFCYMYNKLCEIYTLGVLNSL